jgi:hypothetical protein
MVATSVSRACMTALSNWVKRNAIFLILVFICDGRPSGIYLWSSGISSEIYTSLFCLLYKLNQIINVLVQTANQVLINGRLV